MKDKIAASAEIVLGNINEEIISREKELAEPLADLNRLKTTRDALAELYDLGPEPEPVQTPGPKVIRVARGPRGAGAAAETTAPVVTGKQGRQPTGETIKLMAAARSAPEPFTTASLHLATGLDATLCGNRLNRWKALGFVTTVGRGEFKRTGTFPNEAAAE